MYRVKLGETETERDALRAQVARLRTLVKKLAVFAPRSMSGNDWLLSDEIKQTLAATATPSAGEG